MYDVSLSPNLIKIKFTKITNLLDVLMVFDFYINNVHCVISRINLIKFINGVFWYNDLTKYKNKSILFFLLKLREGVSKSGVESTHILESNLLNHDVILEIKTINRDNLTPTITSREDFKKKLFDEWMNFL